MMIGEGEQSRARRLTRQRRGGRRIDIRANSGVTRRVIRKRAWSYAWNMRKALNRVGDELGSVHRDYCRDEINGGYGDLLETEFGIRL